MIPQAQSSEQLSRRIEATRQSLSVTVGELERRLHAAVDWRAQLRRPAVQLAFAVAGVAIFLGIGLVTRRRRRVSDLERFFDALRRARRHPEHVAKPTPTLPRKVAQAALSAAATTTVKRLVERNVSGP